jgi:hypothetical protein
MANSCDHCEARHTTGLTTKPAAAIAAHVARLLRDQQYPAI